STDELFGNPDHGVLPDLLSEGWKIVARDGYEAAGRDGDAELVAETAAKRNDMVICRMLGTVFCGYVSIGLQGFVFAPAEEVWVLVPCFKRGVNDMELCPVVLR